MERSLASILGVVGSHRRPVGELKEWDHRGNTSEAAAVIRREMTEVWGRVRAGQVLFMLPHHTS